MLGSKFAAVAVEEPTSSIGSVKGSKSTPFAESSTDSAASKPKASAVAWVATTEPQVSFEGSDSAFARTRWVVSSLIRTASAAYCLEMVLFAAATIVNWWGVEDLPRSSFEDAAAAVRVAAIHRNLPAATAIARLAGPENSESASAPS